MPDNLPGENDASVTLKSMDDRARWARKEKDGEGFYTVDLVETFFSKVDLL